MYSLGEIRVGHTVVIDGDPYLLVACQHKKQARGAGILKTTMKNLRTGVVVPKTFQGNEKLSPADVGYFRVQYLYRNGEEYEFMKNDTYEQFSISAAIVGDDALLLKEGEEVDVQHFEGQPIRVQFPPSMIFVVSESPPGVRGDTASGGTKPATLENGLVVQVPLFVDEGDMIQINTETKEFQKRVSS
jgi:elongation factor P